MKKIALALFIIIAFTSMSFSQIGFRAGGNLASQPADFVGNSLERTSKLGFLIGINYKAKLSESLALRPGIQFASKGYSIEVNGLEVEPNFNYLEVPVDVVFAFGNLGIHTGPYAAILISAKVLDLDLKEEVKPIDVGLNIGLGYTIGSVGLGANYGLGLSNISNYKIVSSVKNKALSIYLTYTL